MRRIRWRQGVRSGILTSWELGKVIFPVTLLVSILQFTSLIDWLVLGLSPAMSWMGLPGEAAIPLVLGNLLNLYAGIGAILSLDLTVKQVFILAVMLSFSHNLLVESAVCRKVGIPSLLVMGVRMVLAAISACIIHWVWQGGGETAVYGMIPPSGTPPDGWPGMLLQGVETAAFGVLQMTVVVFPLMVAIQILKDLLWLERFAGWVKPLMRPLGIDTRGSVILAGGLLFGLAMGAGVIIEQAREKGFTRRDMTVMVLFLAACHAVVEDTLIFIPLGIPVLPLLLIRLGVAVLLTLFLAWLWPRPSNTVSRSRAAGGGVA
ncbi:nucleoside recognition protein [Melghirimyces profundicolus]|uniref:Nucleoside recognition protein n=1 Tax=Melghirimyces profundicolus TaxID=1242148 RepID=A0A2T6BU79_9BACL|nr:nucleoside recognition domain-containing protein [Melghirimyces profundicolus]PTX59645.1 nucleoside recognition protein [Melghirimyces profundicolus]